MNRSGVGKCTEYLNHESVPKTCTLYFADIELARYIHTHIPAYISMHIECLGEGKNFSFDLNKDFILCKHSFLGGHRNFLKSFHPSIELVRESYPFKPLDVSYTLVKWLPD